MLKLNKENHIEQRTDEWFNARLGKFTASQISRLLGKETLKTTKQSIDTYAFEKAVESIYGKEEQDYISADMQRGIDLEPLAFSLFKDLKGYEFIDVTECGFFKYEENAGASPDGLVSDNSILEIKCPRRDKFFKIVANGLEEIDLKYMAQMQMQMLATDTEKAYFLNYYVNEGIQYWHELIVNRDEDMIDLIKERIEMANVVKNDYIKKITENAQY